MKPTTFNVAAPAGAMLAVMLAAMPLTAAAQSDYHPAPGFNFGGGIGSNSLNGRDYTGNGNHVESRQTAFKGFAGVRVNDNVSFEAQFIDFGTAEDGSDRVKAHGLTAGALLEAPMSRHVRPYGKLGGLYWNADGNFSGVSRNDSGIDFTYGAGLRFLLTRNVDIRTEYERFEFNQNDVHTISAMLQINL